MSKDQEFELTPEMMLQLSDDEIALLRSIGMKEAKKKHTSASIGQEYDLVVTTVCKLCGSTNVKMYHMTKEVTYQGLVSHPVDSVSPDYVRKFYQVKHCPSCRSYLLRLSPSQIIDLLIQELSRDMFSTKMEKVELERVVYNRRKDEIEG
jgi:hypothetical protein